MWVRLEATDSMLLYIAICYFSLNDLGYARLVEGKGVEKIVEGGSSPYGDLLDEIMKYKEMEKVLLVEDFNACTQS